jgi:hypothetical protein
LLAALSLMEHWKGNRRHFQFVPCQWRCMRRPQVGSGPLFRLANDEDARGAAYTGKAREGHHIQGAVKSAQSRYFRPRGPTLPFCAAK